MKILHQGRHFKCCFQTKQDIRHFLHGNYNILCLRSSNYHSRPNVELTREPKKEYFFVFDREVQATTKSALILGYSNGSCGSFAWVNGQLHFQSHNYLNDQLSNQLAHYLLEEIALTQDEQWVQLESILLTLMRYLHKKQLEFTEYKSVHALGISPYKLQKIEQFILSNLDKGISLEKLSKIAEMSLFHFIRMFKRSTGVTPHQFVSHLKLERARCLLQETELPVIQICFETGFNSPSHFSKVFKRNFGITPLKFRQRIAG